MTATSPYLSNSSISDSASSRASTVCAPLFNCTTCPFQSGDIPSIDQALVGDQIGIQLVDELTVGLLRQNEVSGAIENGMAESFEVSADGRVYTFKIRQGVPWVRYNAETDAVEEALDCDGKV